MMQWLSAVAMIAAVATCGAMRPALSYVDTDCQMGIGVAVCKPKTTAPGAKIINLETPVHHEDVTDDDRREWENACQPRKVWDGATIRWRYSLRNCEFGPLPGNVHLR